MTILEDINKIIEREIGDEKIEVSPLIKKDNKIKEKFSGSYIGEIMKHIDALKAAVEFVDTLTTDEAETAAFEAEIALRKALVKMENLADESKKVTKKQ